MIAEPVSTTSSTIRGMQIVSAGLLAGTIATSAMFIYLKMGPLPDKIADFGFPIITTFASVLMALAGCIVLFALPRGIGKRIDAASRTQPAAAAFPQVYMANHIVSSALIEGATIVALQAFLLESEWTALAIAGVGGVFLASLFPTAAKYHSFVAQHSGQLPES